MSSPESIPRFQRYNLDRVLEIYGSKGNRNSGYFLEFEKALIAFEQERSEHLLGESKDIKISRRYSSYGAGNAIDTAERNFPDRQKVLDAMEPDYVSSLEIEKLPEDLWWYTKNKIPYALTKGAVDYYSSKAIELSKEEEVQVYGFDPLSFSYEADSKFHTFFEIEDIAYQNVFVVRQTLRWSYSGGGFSKERLSIVDLNFEVIFVSGDGQTVFIMI